MTQVPMYNLTRAHTLFEWKLEAGNWGLCNMGELKVPEMTLETYVYVAKSHYMVNN